MGLLRKQMLEEPSPNQPERFYGVVVAEVEDNNELPDAPTEMPLGPGEGVVSPACRRRLHAAAGRRARAPMAGKGMGFYALPEKGEQVLVAFEHGDLAKPYVLGSLWTDKQPPPSPTPTGTTTSG